MPSPWMILPFGILLGSIAMAPLLAHRWWEKHYSKLALLLGAVTLFYYFFVMHAFHRIFETFHEYIGFIALVGSLFVVAGGIHIRVKGASTPLANTAMLGLGALLANLVGTTGASMLLIRPFLRANKYRLTAYHVVFFIFIVSNVGGALTPIGDPPLYLGYLKGIPFFWTMEHLFPMWSVGVGFLLIFFYVLDRKNFLRAPKEIREKETSQETWKFEGLPNLAWLAVILGSLWLEKPAFLREVVMLGAVLGSWFTTRKSIHEANDFSWKPILEVIILFAGIFATMMPALDWLAVNSGRLGVSSVGSYYWGTGLLSAVLDNAPTYLNFLSAAMGSLVDPSVSTESLKIQALATQHAAHIAAMSIGAVFFGACTYIGNGPNFMVKSIAENSGVKMPTFFGFIFKYTLSIMVPLLILIWWMFFNQ